MFKPRRINGKGKPPKKYCSQKCAQKSLIGRVSPKKTSKGIIDLIKQFYPKYGAEPIMRITGKTKKAISLLACKNGIKLHPDIYRARVHDAAQEYMSTPKNPNYIDGVSMKDFGKTWHRQRNLCRKRDDFKCQVCGEYGNTVHHIKPRRLFKDHIEDANSLDNLITLCKKHHMPVERGKIPCPIPKPHITSLPSSAINPQPHLYPLQTVFEFGTLGK